MKTLTARLMMCGATLVAVVATGGGCAGSGRSLRMRLESFDPADRILAIRDAGRRNDRDCMGALVDRLDDQDVAVRLYAILALERMTDTRMGYAYATSADKRQRAVAAWRRYIGQRAAEQGTVSQHEQGRDPAEQNKSAVQQRDDPHETALQD